MTDFIQVSALVKEIRNLMLRLGHVKKLRFDTILFVSSCLPISEIPVKKGRISYHNESNQKSWLHAFFVFTCAHEDSLWTKNNVNVCVFMSFQFQRFLSKKAEFLITMRATKSFDTILFVSTCLQISEIPVTKKAEFLITMRAIKSLDSILFCLHMCSWRLIVNKK